RHRGGGECARPAPADESARPLRLPRALRLRRRLPAHALPPPPPARRPRAMIASTTRRGPDPRSTARSAPLARAPIGLRGGASEEESALPFVPRRRRRELELGA